MLDHVSISHQSGLILWSRSYNPAFTSLSQSPRSPINTLIRDVMIENTGNVDPQEEGVQKDGFSIRWTVENGLGLVFVIVFPALLPLTYIPDLLTRTKSLFLSLFSTYLQTLITSLSATQSSLTTYSTSALTLLKDQIAAENWSAIFERCLRGCEERAEAGRNKARVGGKKSQLAKEVERKDAELDSRSVSSDDGNPVLSAEEIAKNIAAFKSSKGGKGEPGLGGSGKSTPSGSVGGSPASKKGRGGKGGAGGGSAAEKIMRKWGDRNGTVSEAEMAEFDFSGPDSRPETPGLETPKVNVEDWVDRATMGQRGKDGLYEVAEWDVKGNGRKDVKDLLSEEEILARGKLGNQLSNLDLEDPAAFTSQGKESRLSSLFGRLTGKKVLTKEDLDPVLGEMEKHLMSKNVAKEISEKLCAGVGSALVGKKLGGMSTIRSEVNSALSTSITQILSPKTSTDILLDIKRKASLPLPPSPDPSLPSKRDPYTLTFVGVNGVGKSTNLSKVAFWLLQNRMRVLIAACDTFRSGAVEQLRVHVRNLGMLESQLGGSGAEEGKRIDLFERGYGKDAAGIAKDAIAYAKENGFDVVLIDTAGRMQDNEPLMRALAKVVTVNNPDKVIFVGEALVGNEAVDQLSKFDKSLREFSAASYGAKGKGRGIDGILLTKFDTVDDKVGSAVTLSYIIGQPILFVGCGQTYSDLKSLKVGHIVQALLSD